MRSNPPIQKSPHEIAVAHARALLDESEIRDVPFVMFAFISGDSLRMVSNIHPSEIERLDAAVRMALDYFRAEQARANAGISHRTGRLHDA